MFVRLTEPATKDSEWMNAMIMSGIRADRFARGKSVVREIRLRVKPFLLLLAILHPGESAFAQAGRIHRCIGSNGEPTYSDRKCDGPALPSTATSASTADASAKDATSIVPGSSMQTCPTSPEDLRNRAVSAFKLRSGVGFSGLFLWDGVAQASSLTPLRELAQLMSGALISIDLDTVSEHAQDQVYPDLPRRPAGAVDTELVVRTVAERERQVPYESISRFGLIEHSGCWWLRLP